MLRPMLIAKLSNGILIQFTIFLHLLTASNFDKLKTRYLKAQRNQRVDTLLSVLLRMEEDSFVKQASTAFGLRQATSRADTMQRHSKGLAIPDPDMVQNNNLAEQITLVICTQTLIML